MLGPSENPDLQETLTQLGITIEDIQYPVVGLIEGKVVEFSIGDVIEDSGTVVGFYDGRTGNSVVLYDETKTGVEAVKMLPFDK